MVKKNQSYTSQYPGSLSKYWHPVYEMDSLQKALEFVDIAINLDKVYSNAYFVKGTILERQGNLKEAQKNYSQASTLNPKFTKAMEESERLRKQLEAVKK